MILLCDWCARNHARTKELKVRCYGSVIHGKCHLCGNQYADGTVVEVSEDTQHIVFASPKPVRNRITDIVEVFNDAQLVERYLDGLLPAELEDRRPMIAGCVVDGITVYVYRHDGEERVVHLDKIRTEIIKRIRAS